jgi:hypothetical protein
MTRHIVFAAYYTIYLIYSNSEDEIPSKLTSVLVHSQFPEGAIRIMKHGGECLENLALHGREY